MGSKQNVDPVMPREMLVLDALYQDGEWRPLRGRSRQGGGREPKNHGYLFLRSRLWHSLSRWHDRICGNITPEPLSDYPRTRAGERSSG